VSFVERAVRRKRWLGRDLGSWRRRLEIQKGLRHGTMGLGPRVSDGGWVTERR